MEFRRVPYRSLNARQQEAFNFQKVSAVLADFGFSTIRLTSDWEGADFVAQHMDGVTFLRVQLKGRLTVGRKYQGKGLHICFPDSGAWYLVPHDELLARVLEITSIAETVSWAERGGYSWKTPPRALLAVLEPYRLE